MIRVRYSSCDGCSEVRKYKALAAARTFAHKMVGAHPDLGRTYAVSFDGIGKVEVEGATLADLFPEPQAPAPIGPLFA
jgi:hypothetical protein